MKQHILTAAKRLITSLIPCTFTLPVICLRIPGQSYCVGKDLGNHIPDQIDDIEDLRCHLFLVLIRWHQIVILMEKWNKRSKKPLCTVPEGTDWLT